MNAGRRIGISAAIAAAALVGIALIKPRPAALPVITDPAANRFPAPVSPPSLAAPVPLPPVAEFGKVAAGEDPGERSRGLDALLREWAAQDARSAAVFVLGLEDEALRRECMLRVMEAWGANDAAAALAWAGAAGFESPYEREIMMSMACTTAARRDPRVALELGLAHGLDGFTNGVLGALVEQWAEADLMTACAWVEGQAAGERRDAWVESVALVVFEVDPVQAARWVTRRMRPGEGRDRALETLLGKLAWQDPQAAREWAGTIAEPAVRERLLERVELARKTRAGG